MNPNAVGRLCLPLLLAGSLSACAAAVPRAGGWSGPGPELAGRLQRAENLLAQSRPAEALAMLEAIEGPVGESPDVLRLRQNARMDLGQDIQVRRDAEARAAARPEDAMSHYLLARAGTDGAEAERLLRRSLSLDPDLVWARIGLAQMLDASGRAEAALNELDGADVSAPGHPWTALVRAQVLLGDRRADDAEASLRDVIERDPKWHRGWAALGSLLQRIPGREAEAHEAWAEAFGRIPGNRGTASAWRRALEEGASPAEWQRVLELTSSLESPTPQALHLEGVALAALGRHGEASSVLRRALEAGEERTEVLDDLRLSLFVQERYVEALAAEAVVTPLSVLRDAEAETDGLRPALLRAARLLEQGQGGDPQVLAQFLDLCRSAGWLREAALLATRRLAADPGSASARKDVAETVSALRFLADLRRSWKGRYFSYSGGDDGPDLEHVLEDLGERSRRHLGHDVTRGMARWSFGMLGAMAETVRAHGPCRRWFEEHGLALVVGQAIGNPVEARLLRVVSLRRDREESLLGRRFRATTVVGEGLLIPSYREARGSVLGGATIGDLVFVDLEGVARWSGAAVRSHHDEAERAALESVASMDVRKRGERTTRRYPGRLSDRLGLSVSRWSDSLAALEDFLAAARAHEFAHAADSSRYLPISSHPWNGLCLFVRGGLSGEGVAAVLEGDAEIVALATAPEPRATLSTLTSFLPSREGGAPHGRGYWDVLEELLEVLEDDPLALVDVDPGENLVRALDRVPPDRLRAAALVVCRRRGLVGEGE